MERELLHKAPMSTRFWLSTLVLLSVPLSYADQLTGFCTAPTACVADGVSTLVDSSSPTFGFSYVRTTSKFTSRTGDDVLAFLLPDNEDANPALVSFAVNSTDAGTNDATTVTEEATLASSKVWDYGYLGAFLGNFGLPNQLYGLYGAGNSDVSKINPGVTGYYVYWADFGSTDITASAPTFNLGGFNGLAGLPKGTFIVDFLHVFNSKGANDGTVATLNSTALLTDVSPISAAGATVPEPGSIFLLGTVLLTAALLAKKRIAS